MLINSGALGASSLGLPIIVARTSLLVAIGARGHTQTLCAAFLTEEHAWFLVGCG